MKRIWITRTRPGADKSARAWAAAGFDPVIAPLMIVKSVQSRVAIPDKAALIFTSGHAVRLSGVEGDDRPVYTVGEATADVAREFGFRNVTSADGDWQALLDIIPDTDRPVIHLSGEVVRGRLIERLRVRGIDAQRVIVYCTDPVTEWPVDPSTLDAVALYSPLATQTLTGLPERPLGHLSAFCLSEAVAEGLSGLSIKIASRPNESALIACSRAADA